jgi:hypothetical protein
MRLSLDPARTIPRHVTHESLALAEWYDAHPAIRRLWGIREGQELRVIIALEPTNDGNDIAPPWLGNSDAWTRELDAATGASVRLELIDETREIEVDGECVIVADLYWRDSTLIPLDAMSG